MPIKPENRAAYPAGKEWKAIREEILARAGNRCEWPGCGVENGTIGYRDEDGYFCVVENSHQGDADAEGKNAIRIVLTTAHKDHDPGNNGTPGNRPNLAAWCQYHHLRYDAIHHAKNARKTREAKKGQETMSL